MPLARRLRSYFMLDAGPGRNAAMEGLRGYAVLLVVFIHAMGIICYNHRDSDPADPSPIWKILQRHTISDTLLLTLSMGHYAVDLFFLLSAFLITRIVARQQGRVSYAAYIRKRFLRIYPPFLVSLVFAAWVQAFVLQKIPIKMSIVLPNLVFAHGAPVIGWKIAAYNFPAWSLFYEFSFYLVFPLLFVLWKRTQGSPNAWSFMSGVLLLAAVLYTHAYLPRAATFFFGIMLGLRSDDELRRIARGLPTWLVAGFYVALSVAYATLSRNFNWFTPFYSVGIVMLFVKTCYDEGLLNRLFANLPLRWLGNISYSLYLMHMPAMMLLDHWLPMRSWGLHPLADAAVFVGMGMVVSLSAGLALYAGVERWYFRKPKATSAVEPLRLAA